MGAAFCVGADAVTVWVTTGAEELDEAFAAAGGPEFLDEAT